MSIFKANKKYLTQAYENVAMADMYQKEQAVIDMKRNILANIRQERLAESQVRFAQNMEGVTTSGTAGALGNIQSSFAEPLEYTYGYMQRQDKITYHYDVAQEALNKYQKQAKKAAQVGGTLGLISPVSSLIVGGVAGADSNYYKGAIETQLGALKGAATGAATGAAAGPYGAIVGAAIGGATGGIGSIFSQTGKNRSWAKASNSLNWSMSNYYGTQFKPVYADDWNLDLSGVGFLASGLFGGDEKQQPQTTTVEIGSTSGSATYGNNMSETWGTRSTYSTTGLLV